MRKSFLLIIVLVACFLLIISYIFLSSENILRIGNGGGEEGSSVLELPFKIPFISPDEEETGSGVSTGAEGAGTGEGGGSGEPYVPPAIYTLNIDSIPPELLVYMEYETNDNVFNLTQQTPFSFDFEENVVVCVADATGYSGVVWLLDEVGCEFEDCGEFAWGCSILMNGPHNATLRQYS